MNTDTLLRADAVAQVELEFRRCRLSTRKDLMSWIQYVLIYCERNQLSLSEVTSDDSLLELLNILWLRAIRISKQQDDPGAR
jgi:hypothetical protein